MVLEPKKMKVGEMREALQARGLDTSGLKNDLIHRLEMALDEEEFGVSEAPPTNAAATVVAADPVVEPAVENSVAVETPVAAVAAEESVPAAGPVDVPVVTNKNAERAARFGIPVVEAAPAEKLKEGLEKKSGGDKNNGKQRGGKLSEPDEAKKKARMERFGDVKSNLSPEEIAKRAERQKRFATESDLKAQARAERFAATVSE